MIRNMKSRPRKGGRFGGNVSVWPKRRPQTVSKKDELDGLRISLRRDGVPWERAKQSLQQAGAGEDYIIRAELWWLLGEDF